LRKDSLARSHTPSQAGEGQIAAQQPMTTRQDLGEVSQDAAQHPFLALNKKAVAQAGRREGFGSTAKDGLQEGRNFVDKRQGQTVVDW
jgi:hypothetical protein